MAKKKEMTVGETCRQLIKGISDAVINTITSMGETPKSECKATICCEGDCHTDIKPKRARGKKGKFLADDKTTKDINEAWVGGKAPKKKTKKKKGKK
jgi:hypothetical protein